MTGLAEINLQEEILNYRTGTEIIKEIYFCFHN